MTGSIFFVRAVCANSGAKVRNGSELQLTQGGSFLNIAWRDRCVMSEERCECTQGLSIAFHLHVSVCGCFALGLMGKADYISLLLKEGVCRGQH